MTADFDSRVEAAHQLLDKFLEELGVSDLLDENERMKSDLDHMTKVCDEWMDSEAKFRDALKDSQADRDAARATLKAVRELADRPMTAHFQGWKFLAVDHADLRRILDAADGGDRDE